MLHNPLSIEAIHIFSPTGLVQKKSWYVQPIQRIFRLGHDEQSIDSIQDLSHGDMSRVVAVKYIVADTAHTVDVTVVHLFPSQVS